MKTAHTSIPLEGLYAFWPYDQVPYYCCGAITRMDLAGRVETRNFGKGHWFKPCLIVPTETGEKMKEVLDALEQRHTGELKRYLDDARRAADLVVKGGQI